MRRPNYAILVCGHEGYETFFGPFQWRDVEAWALNLRERIRQARTREHYAREIWQQFYDIYGYSQQDSFEAPWPIFPEYDRLTWFDPDAVCIARSDPKTLEYECACGRFPQFKTGRPWWH